MNQTQNPKPYDLGDRTFRFARDCRDVTKQLPQTLTNLEDAKQLARSSGSQAANYIEASASLTKKDFLHRMMICRKETKESLLWLKLCDTAGTVTVIEQRRRRLMQEAPELTKIFGSMVEKSKGR